uniref:Uncharacterized protein n=1 Tax=Sipha flava TaxID=143950 RepID=A0A2S2QVZ6_9HEMI
MSPAVHEFGRFRAIYDDNISIVFGFFSIACDVVENNKINTNIRRAVNACNVCPFPNPFTRNFGTQTANGRDELKQPPPTFAVLTTCKHNGWWYQCKRCRPDGFPPARC